VRVVHEWRGHNEYARNGKGVVLNMARQGADLRGVATFHGSLAAANPRPP